MKLPAILVLFPLFSCLRASADVLQFGDKDVLGTGSYVTDPVTGATLEGLTPGQVTYGIAAVPHSFPFSPSPGEFQGTDRMYAGSAQTASHEGYSADPARFTGPQVITLDYSTAVGALDSITTFTLGLAADDFQFPVLGQPFSARINGIPHPGLTDILNSLQQTGPTVQFVSLGLPTSLLSSDHILNLEIDNVGDGGDGWALDFLTVGVTTEAIPEPSITMISGIAGGVFLLRRRRGVPCPASQI